MTGIEIAAIIMIVMSFVGAFLNIQPWWSIENKALSLFASTSVSLGLFLGAMVLLFAWG